MNVRIVPHSIFTSSNITWWKVQVRVPLLYIGKIIRLKRWVTVGDYSRIEAARVVAKTILEEEFIEKA